MLIISGDTIATQFEDNLGSCGFLKAMLSLCMQFMILIFRRAREYAMSMVGLRNNAICKV